MKFRIANCNKCKEETMLSNSLLYESMQHWGDPSWEKKSFGTVYRSGFWAGVIRLLKVEACIATIAVVIVAIAAN